MGGGNLIWITIRGTNLAYNWLKNHSGSYWYISAENEGYIKLGPNDIKMEDILRKSFPKWGGIYLSEYSKADIISMIPDQRIRKHVHDFIFNRDIWFEQIKNL